MHRITSNRSPAAGASRSPWRKATSAPNRLAFSWANAKAETIKELLPVYDNLARALQQKTEDEAYAKGVEMIMTQMKNALEKLGVEAIPAAGQTFDPNLHNAVMHVDDEDLGENVVVEVFQDGFKLGDKIIRHAMVKVAN